MPDAGTDMRMDSKDPPFGKKESKYTSLPDTENNDGALINGPDKSMYLNFFHTKKVGNYLIGKTLGEGSFAKVREGLHLISGEKVAVKIIDKQKVANDSYVLKNLHREGKIQQRIRHPNITQLLDIMESHKYYYLVMELCTGGNLMDHICEKERLEEKEVQKFIQQLVIAVMHLHRNGIVHRDLKIENLLLNEQGDLKLIDFGLSNSAGILGHTNGFSTQCGSPAYAAPELLSRESYGPKVDVWSIGVNMFAMLAGTLPFTVSHFNLTTLHQKMVDRDMNPLPRSVSPEARRFLRSLLEPNPDDRPNIYQVMADPWLKTDATTVTKVHRIHIEEINHSIVLEMRDLLNIKPSEVLSVLLTNKACPTLATYFLLNKKKKRSPQGLNEKNEKMAMEMEKERSQISEWKKYIEKQTIPQKEIPLYLAKCKELTKEKKPKTGLLKAVTGGLKDVYSGQEGCVTSSSLEFLEIPDSKPEAKPERKVRTKKSPKGFSKPVRPPSSLSSHSWSNDRQKNKESPPSPWYKLTNGELSPPRHVSAFQPESAYLKKATIPKPNDIKITGRIHFPKSSLSSTDSSGSSPSSGGSEKAGSPPHSLKFALINGYQLMKQSWREKRTRNLKKESESASVLAKLRMTRN